MITTIESVVGEVNGLIADAQEGNLKTRGKPEQFVGSYREIIEGINNMLEAITTPLNEALRVADLFAHAKFGSRFDESVEVRGDLIALKEGLNTVGRELSLVIREVSDQVGALTASAEEAAASVEEVTAGAAYPRPEFWPCKYQCRKQCQIRRTGAQCHGGSLIIRRNYCNKSGCSE